MANFIDRVANALKRVPDLGWIAIAFGVFGLVLFYGGYSLGRGPSANPEPSAEGAGAVPLSVFLLGALLASYLLAGVISMSQKNGLSRRQELLVGSVIAIIAIALVFGSWQLSDEKPNKTHFLVAANFIAIALLVLGFCYLPKLIKDLRGITSPFLRVSMLLSIAGGAGGFASHLAKHEGDLVIPTLVMVNEAAVIAAEPSPMPTAPAQTAPTAPTTATATPSPEEDRPLTVRRLAFHIGFLADILIGLIAANALHLALASLISYQEGAPENRRKQYFTFLALGILTGFGGARTLQEWAQQATKADVQAIVRKEVADRRSEETAPPEPDADLPQAAATSKAITDSLVRLEWPNSTELALMTNFAAALEKARKPVDKRSMDELVAAAGSLLFVNPATGFTQAKPHLAQATSQANAGRSTPTWTAKVLRVIALTMEGTRSGKSGWYGEVRGDASQLYLEAANSEQRYASATIANFAAFAAIVTQQPEQPDWDLARRRFDWGSGGSVKAKRAAEFAKELRDFLQKYTSQTTAPPQGAGAGQVQITALPSPSSSPPPAAPARSPSPSASDTPSPSPAPASDHRVALFRLATEMHAAPREFLEKYETSSETEKSALTAFAEQAPRLRPPAAASTSSPSPANAATPASTPASGVANPTPTAVRSPQEGTVVPPSD